MTVAFTFRILLILTLASKAILSSSTTHSSTYTHFRDALSLSRLPNSEDPDNDFCRLHYKDCEFCCSINKCQSKDDCQENELSNLYFCYGVVFTQLFIIMIAILITVYRAGHFRKFFKFVDRNRDSNLDNGEDLITE
jgi:hypothetical protein